MLNILIVDDEYLIRMRINKAINWDEHNAQLFGEAEDGETALNIIRKEQIDIVLLDINIPRIDGIELARIIYNDYPMIKIIMITGFDEFHYVKAAIDAGVIGYLLKPLNKEELNKLIVKAIDMIESLNNMKKQLNILSFKVDKKEKNIWLLKRLKESESEEHPKELFEYLNVLKVSIDKLWNMEKCLLSQNKFVVMNIVTEVFDGFTDSIDVVNIDHAVYIILSMKEPFSDIYLDRIRSRFLKVNNMIRDNFNFTISLGISSCCSKCSLYKLKQEADWVAMAVYFAKDEAIIQYNQLDDSKKINEVFLKYDKSFLQLKFRSHRYEELYEIVSRIFDDSINQVLDKAMLEYISIDILVMTFKYLEEVGIQNKINFSELKEKIASIDRAIDLKYFILNYLKNCVEEIKKNEDCRKDPIIKEAMEYIENNFQNSKLTLDIIADYTHVTSAYLSTKFKKQMGISIVECITKYRIAFSKKMINEEQTINNAELAEAVGYNDPLYFSKCFKKIVGVSPQKYKKNLL